MESFIFALVAVALLIGAVGEPAIVPGLIILAVICVINIIKEIVEIIDEHTWLD